MAEFERKKRYIKYDQSCCKFFLRKDFHKQCAYCLIREADIGNPDNFEKDHFVPQTGGMVGRVHTKYSGEEFDVDNYYNLYYCCQRCNGRSGKSNKWSPSLLDPCADDIWDIHIKRLENGFLQALTDRGEEYISIFQLNSKKAIEYRQKIEQGSKTIKDHLAALEGFIEKYARDPALLEWFSKERENDLEKLKYGIHYDSNASYLDESSVAEAEAILSKYQIVKNKGDYELDYTIKIQEVEYEVKLVINDGIKFLHGEKGFYLPVRQVEDWNDKNVLICHYDTQNKKMYYLNFHNYLQNNPVNKSQERYFYKIQNTDTLN